MGSIIRRVAVGAATVVGGIGMMAAPAFAHDCTNASKDAHNPGAGVQVIFNADTGAIEWTTPGLMQRIQRGGVDLDSGAGFHGLIGLDFDGDGTADIFTYIVGPNGALPDTAQQNGSPDHGIVNICTVIDCGGGGE